MWNIAILLPMFFCFSIRILAEINRKPIDLVEGRSWFNVEYFGAELALIFVAEDHLRLFSFVILFY